MMDRIMDIALENLLERDLRLVAERCGMKVAVALAENMSGRQLYIEVQTASSVERGRIYLLKP